MVHYQLEILISAGLLVCMVIAALMCDLLKGKNEQLREMMVELKVRNQEAERREQFLLAAAAPLMHVGPGTVEGAPDRAVFTRAAPAFIAAPEIRRIALVSNKSAPPGPPFGPLDAAMPEANQTQPKARPLPAETRRGSRHAGERKRELSPGAVTAIERGLQRAAEPSSVITPAPNVKHAFSPGVDYAENSAPAERPFTVPQSTVPPLPESAAAPVGAGTLATVPQVRTAAGLPVPQTPTEKTWNPLVWNSKTTSVKQPALDAVAHPISSIDERNPPAGELSLAIPAGYHDGFVLSSLIQGRRPVSGLVVSIGATGEVTPQVDELMRSLLGDGDFGCQSGPNEFLLIYPKERGATAEHRLSAIAQQLWKFQMQAIGRFSILFSWGGVAVEGETLDVAAASANQRMAETRKGRKGIPEKEVDRKLAVHAA